MAVAKQPQQVKDFLPRLKKRLLAATIGIQLFAILGVGLLLYAYGMFSTSVIGAVTMLVTLALALTGITLLTYLAAVKPLEKILSAIVHIAGERTAVAPPSPNDPAFVRNGLSPVLQTVYELAAASPSRTTVPAESSDGTVPTAATALATTRTAVEEALDATICGFVAMGKDRTIRYANKAAPLLMNTDGVQTLELIFEENDTLDLWLDECEKTAVHAERTWARIPNKLAGQENRRFFDVLASYHKGTENEVVLTLVDRTHLYEVSEDELDFIAFATHELRGPITVIRGYLDVLQGELEDVLEKDQKELFRRLVVSSSRLSGYINNILNTSRYDRRHLRMHLTETTVSAVYETIRDDMELRACAQHRLLSVSIPRDLPTIAADPTSLGEVFTNLIDNAIKYSNEGGSITVAASSKGDTIEVAVIDRGIGMPGNVVTNLFQKFYRSHRSRETVAGTGIGLYISKAIIESHGGTISVRSEDGYGSTFTVSLPTYKVVAEKLKASNNENDSVIKKEGSWIKNHTLYRG